HVASKTLARVDWQGSALVRDVAAEVPRLKEKYARGELQVHGSPGLIQTLLERELVDELNLIVFPVVLGRGKRLFGAGAVPAAFTLAGSSATSTGAVMGTYRWAGKPKVGSFALADEPSPKR